MKKKIIIFSILCIIILVSNIGMNFKILLSSYTGIIALFLSTRYINKNFQYFRKLIQIIILFIPSVLYSNLVISGRITEININLFSIIFLITNIIIFYLLNISKFKLFLSKDFIQITQNNNITPLLKGINIVEAIMFSTAEEFYFRLFVSHFIFENHILFILMNTSLFISFHILVNRKGMFNYKDILNQVWISISASILLIISNSIFFSIILHQSMNLPRYIRGIKEIYYHRKEQLNG